MRFPLLWLIVLISNDSRAIAEKLNKRQSEVIGVEEVSVVEPKLTGDVEEVIEYEDTGVDPEADTVIEGPDGQMKVLKPDGRVILLDDPVDPVDRPMDAGEMAQGSPGSATSACITSSLSVLILTMILYLI